MAISVNWVTGVVTVPKADTVLTGLDPISGREVRSFDTDQFHQNLRSQEETVDGRAWPITHTYNKTVVLGGVAYEPQLEMVNNYQVEFEQVATPYRVVFTNTNNNIADYSVINNVSIQPQNAAAASPGQASVVAAATWDKLEADHTTSGTFGSLLSFVKKAIKQNL